VYRAVNLIMIIAGLPFASGSADPESPGPSAML
jgi:hypothetical protein